MLPERSPHGLHMPPPSCTVSHACSRLQQILAHLHPVGPSSESWQSQGVVIGISTRKMPNGTSKMDMDFQVGKGISYWFVKPFKTNQIDLKDCTWMAQFCKHYSTWPMGYPLQCLDSLPLQIWCLPCKRWGTSHPAGRASLLIGTKRLVSVCLPWT